MGEEETCRQALMMLTNFCMSDNFIHLLPSSREKWVCHAMGSSGNGGEGSRGQGGAGRGGLPPCSGDWRGRGEGPRCSLAMPHSLTLIKYTGQL